MKVEKYVVAGDVYWDICRYSIFYCAHKLRALLYISGKFKHYIKNFIPALYDTIGFSFLKYYEV